MSQECEEHETDIEIICLGHKKSQTASEFWKTKRPTDTRIIRLQLSCQGSFSLHISRAARRLIKERTIVIEGPLPASYLAYRAAVYKLIVGKTKDAYLRYRFKTVMMLFSGCLERSDKYEV